MDHLGVKTEIDRLVNELNHHNQLYYIQNNPIISDIEFDQLLKKLEQLEKEHPEYASENSPTRLNILNLL